MKKYILLLFFTMFVISSVHAQIDNQISDSDIKIIRDRQFKGEALYGFMNGGSDLYLEYGFMELKALELEYNKNKYSVEIYIMPTPEDAFGIYSQHAFKCTPADSLFFCDCTSPRQFQIAGGNLYISIVFSPGSKEAKAGAYKLARYYSEKFGSGEILMIPRQISDHMNNNIGRSLNLKYARGSISLGNINYSVLQYFEGLENYCIWILKKSYSENIFLIRFDNKEHHDTFLQRIKAAGKNMPSEIIPDDNSKMPSILWNFDETD